MAALSWYLKTVVKIIVDSGMVAAAATVSMSYLIRALG